MSERLKYQIKSGGIFAITLALALSFFNALEVGFFKRVY